MWKGHTPSPRPQKLNKMVRLPKANRNDNNPPHHGVPARGIQKASEICARPGQKRKEKSVFVQLNLREGVGEEEGGCDPGGKQERSATDGARFMLSRFRKKTATPKVDACLPCQRCRALRSVTSPSDKGACKGCRALRSVTSPPCKHDMAF